MNPERLAYIRFRLDRAKQTLGDARLLADSGSLLSAVNRLYYACFYCVSARIASEGLKASKHTGVRSLFNRYWVKTGRVAPETGGFYSAVFDQRLKADYADLVHFDPEQVRHWVEEATGFVSAVTRLVEENLPGHEAPASL